MVLEPDAGSSMPDATVELLYGIAHVVLAAAALAVAVMIALRVSQQSSARREPLGIAFCVVFLAVGVAAILRVPVHAVTATSASPTLVVAEWLTAAAMIAFLFLHRRYGVFVESAHRVREFETEYAAKDRE